MTMKLNAGKIEKGVPIPPNQTFAPYKWHRTEIIRKLKKGESVYFACTTECLRTSAKMALGKGRYAVRKWRNGARVWRVK